MPSAPGSQALPQGIDNSFQAPPTAAIGNCADFGAFCCMARIRIGISGWRYPPWRGVFYPSGLPQRLELWYASRILPVIELNGSFYSLQRPEYYARWHAETPADFCFAVKGPRFITHMKRLRDAKAPLANFFASGLFNLRDKLGPILWQLPPSLQYQPDVLAEFLALLPQDFAAAQRLARQHDSQLRGRAELTVPRQLSRQPMRHAMEIRHASFCQPDFIRQLRARRVALVIAETAKKWPMPQDITADFAYLRLHGDRELYRSGYGDRALERWASRIRAWHAGGEPGGVDKVLRRAPPTSRPRDVFCFFDNTDIKLRAPVDAQTLLRKLGLRPGKKPWPLTQA
jgi:uncharacterized protein YecE (DUF72 family)